MSSSMFVRYSGVVTGATGTQGTIDNRGLLGFQGPTGSIGLKACLVADGTATLFVKDIDYKDWDIIPALLINLEVGKIVCDFDGKIIKINKSLKKRKGLIVCERQLVPKILKIVNETKK